MKLTIYGFLKLKFNFWIVKSLKSVNAEIADTRASQMLDYWEGVFMNKIIFYLQDRYDNLWHE